MKIEKTVSDIQIANLTPEVVINDICKGDKNITRQEASLFVAKCQANNLNPFLNEAYIVKYGNKPATMMIGIEKFLKRAAENPNYDGMEFGTICIDNSGNLHDVVGSIVLPNTYLYGGWCRVYSKNKRIPDEARIMWSEYAGDAEWKKKPATMIVKVAKMQSLRAAYPNDFGGIYGAEEQSLSETKINNIDAIETPAEVISSNVETSDEVELPLEVMNVETGEVQEVQPIEVLQAQAQEQKPKDMTNAEQINYILARIKQVTTLSELHSLYLSNLPISETELKTEFSRKKEQLINVE
jgi:phage recombination protein Bet